MIDHYDAKTDMSAMMRTTAFPASIVVQMLASGVIAKRGAVLRECDVPADTLLDEMTRRGIAIECDIHERDDCIPAAEDRGNSRTTA